MLSSRVLTRQGLRANRRFLARRSQTSVAYNSTTLKRAASRPIMNSLRRLPSVLPYSTEKILKSRDSKIDLSKQRILYNANDEKDNCGVGLIANLKSKPSRHVVEVADEMLVRMSHRGGCGCDPASGDGAGEFLLSFATHPHGNFTFHSHCCRSILLSSLLSPPPLHLSICLRYALWNA